MISKANLNAVPVLRMTTLVSLFSAMLATCTSALAATDVVIFNNGDRLTGEVKALDRGRLKFKTDAAGTINIEWDKVEFISADRNIQVETQNGARYFGKIKQAEDGFNLLVSTVDGPVPLVSASVVQMNPIDQERLRDIDLSVSAGYNFTNSSQISQFNIGAEARHRTRKRILTANYASTISNSENNEASQRQTLSFNYTRLRANRWLNDGGVSFDVNDELGVNLRTSFSAGGGRIVRQASNSAVTLKGGLKATRENSVNNPEDVDSLESYGIMTWEWYRYDTPELDWSTSIEIIPSLTESGRVRGEFNATLKWEIISDFFWQFQVYDSYDNQPQSEGAPNNDYGVNTALSYDF